MSQKNICTQINFLVCENRLRAIAPKYFRKHIIAALAGQQITCIVCPPKFHFICFRALWINETF